MANTFIPFDNNPISTAQGDLSSSYTVPAGKFAKVTVSISLRAGIIPSVAMTSGTVTGNQYCNDNVSFDFWLKSGDVLTKTNTFSSAGPVSITSATYFTSDSTSKIEIKSNSNTISSHAITASFNGTPSANGNYSRVSDGITTYYAQEYNNIT